MPGDHLGDGPRRFPETTWSLVARLGSDGRAALETLVQRYWKAVYLYVRVAWSKTDDEALDLTQAFFVWLLEDEPLERFDPGRGSFRAFLKTLLRRFVGHRDRALGRLKRGGGVRHLPLIDAAQLPEARDSDPERALDRAWISEVIDGALTRFAEVCREKDREVARTIYERYELASDGERPDYNALARDLGLEWREVKNHLFWARDQVRGAIRAQLRETTADAAGLEAEWRVLFDA